MDVIRLSTVDRFQGDEADVVLVSLVIDEKSRTPFVKNVNRMIVLLSRARLGMYVFGNKGYFENRQGSDTSVRHWMRTFEMLQQPPKSSDNDPALTTDDVPAALLPADSRGMDGLAAIKLPLTDSKFEKSRVGPKLPLCCPQHPLTSCIEVDKFESIKLGFCQIKCEATLLCSHECGLKCHWPQKQHNQNCSHKIPSPCTRHIDELTCRSVFKNTKGASQYGVNSIDHALEHYRCPTNVPVSLPCHHEVQMACADEDDIARGVQTWPICTKQSPTPYLYPACGHELKVTCHQLSEYTKSPSKVKACKTKVDYTPIGCSHVRSIPCYLKQQHENGIFFVCPERLEVSLPRCGHTQKVSCANSVRLQGWTGIRCEELGRVYQVSDFGSDCLCTRIEHTDSQYIVLPIPSIVGPRLRARGPFMPRAGDVCSSMRARDQSHLLGGVSDEREWVSV
jgi:hypothetical protein